VSRRRGLTLLEVLIASILLVIMGVAVMGVFATSGRGIKKTDERRLYRFFVDELLARAQRHSLHHLWDHFGPASGGAPRPLGGSLADLGVGEPGGPPGDGNPLGLTIEFLRELSHYDLDASVRFDFYTREELGVDQEGKPDPETGILHMQAGWLEVTLFPAGEPDNPIQVVKQPLMCPAIVGRPGLKLSSCPAVAPATKCKYGPILAAKEGFSWPTDVAEACERLARGDDGSPSSASLS
jgi:hypothetical protein